MTLKVVAKNCIITPNFREITQGSKYLQGTPRGARAGRVTCPCAAPACERPATGESGSYSGRPTEIELSWIYFKKVLIKPIKLVMRMIDWSIDVSQNLSPHSFPPSTVAASGGGGSTRRARTGPWRRAREEGRRGTRSASTTRASSWPQVKE